MRTAGLFLLASALQFQLGAASHMPAYRRQATTGTATATATGTTTTAAEAEVTAISDCHFHGTTQYCMFGATEFQISGITTTSGAASSYTDCHNHGSETWCMAPDTEVLILGEDETAAAATTTGTTTGGTAAAATTTSAASLTAISECHLHESSLYCMAGTAEYYVHTTVTGTATSDIPAQFTDCHSHGSESYCVTETGDDVEVSAADDADEATEETTDSDTSEESSSSGENCHFHAGVEHCTGSSSEESSSTSCARVSRDYNIPLRIGLLFVILATSSIGVFGPIFLASFVAPRNFVFVLLRQFGTGVIISTAFVHLLTHATLMFESECLGELSYEATSTAVMMAGLFLSFLVEFAGYKYLQWKTAKDSASVIPPSSTSQDLVHIIVFESGVVFHSIIIGLTLVVSGDSTFLTLFAVIVFHQMFEGIALGTKIASVGHQKTGSLSAGGHCGSPTLPSATATSSNGSQEAKGPVGTPLPMGKKLMLATAFALVTPVGMAIGIGVLHKFNGNDPHTIVAIGTLDALSAGILVWVGVVEMWARDWTDGGDMVDVSAFKTFLGLFFLVAGMLLMSVLGKWA